MDNEVTPPGVPAKHDLRASFRDVMAAVCTPVSVSPRSRTAARTARR